MGLALDPVDFTIVLQCYDTGWVCVMRHVKSSLKMNDLYNVSGGMLYSTIVFRCYFIC